MARPPLLELDRPTTEYDFPVELRPISTEPDGFVIPNRLAVIRTDTMRSLGVVSSKYALLPHADVVGTLRDTLKGQTVEEKIGVTHNGARMHVEMTLPTITLSIDGDEIAMRVIVINSYDTSRKVQISFGAVRLVCSNGMIIGRQFISLKRRHTGDMHLEVAQIQNQMHMLTERFQATAPVLQKMALSPLKLPPKKFFDSKQLCVPTYLTTIAREQFKKSECHSVWDAYNALTFAITHKMRKNNPAQATALGIRAWTAASGLVI